jgi:hypothetical protein
MLICLWFKAIKREGSESFNIWWRWDVTLLPFTQAGGAGDAPDLTYNVYWVSLGRQLHL